jgi:hypothetical protein
VVVTVLLQEKDAEIGMLLWYSQRTYFMNWINVACHLRRRRFSRFCLIFLAAFVGAIDDGCGGGCSCRVMVA